VTETIVAATRNEALQTPIQDRPQNGMGHPTAVYRLATGGKRSESFEGSRGPNQWGQSRPPEDVADKKCSGTLVALDEKLWSADYPAVGARGKGVRLKMPMPGRPTVERIRSAFVILIKPPLGRLDMMGEFKPLRGRLPAQYDVIQFQQ